MKPHLCLLFFLLIYSTAFSQQTIITKLENAGSEYDIQDSVMITTRDGASISAMVVFKKGLKTPKPVILQFTIYVRDKGRDIRLLREAADRDYVGVIAYTRGKRFSPVRYILMNTMQMTLMM